MVGLDVDGGGAVHMWGLTAHKKYLYLPFIFPLNLNLWKIKSIKIKKGKKGKGEGGTAVRASPIRNALCTVWNALCFIQPVQILPTDQYPFQVPPQSGSFPMILTCKALFCSHLCIHCTLMTLCEAKRSPRKNIPDWESLREPWVLFFFRDNWVETFSKSFSH